jgi:hypothetical protein
VATILFFLVKTPPCLSALSLYTPILQAYETHGVGSIAVVGLGMI